MFGGVANPGILGVLGRHAVVRTVQVGREELWLRCMSLAAAVLERRVLVTRRFVLTAENLLIIVEILTSDKIIEVSYRPLIAIVVKTSCLQQLDIHIRVINEY